MARTLRTVQKKGGLDGFLMGTDDRKLEPGAFLLSAAALATLGVLRRSRHKRWNGRP